MNEQEILNRIKKKAKEDHEYFGNKNKPERERYVASLFLSILGLEFNEDELSSPEQSSNVDVIFKECRFQVKEVMDEGYPRGQFYKDCRKSAEKAKSLADLHLVSKGRDIPPPDTMYNLVLKKMPSFSEKYAPGDRKEIDLLIYLTITRASLLQECELKKTDFADLGWRSVCCVNEKQAVVLFSSNEAPSLIKLHSGKVIWTEGSSQ